LNVAAFVEKPNLQTAQQYLSEGGYYWNAGMFVLKASVWLAAIAQFAPAILQSTRTAWAARKTDGVFVRPGKTEFEAISSESVDYAVMEHCPGSAFPIQMVPLDAGWNDLGAWDAIWQVQPKDAQGNAHVGDVLHTDSHNTLVHASSRLVALVGVSDLVVVETADAVLVTSTGKPSLNWLKASTSFVHSRLARRKWSGSKRTKRKGPCPKKSVNHCAAKDPISNAGTVSCHTCTWVGASASSMDRCKASMPGARNTNSAWRNSG
jgi:hypothetical protein